MLTEVHAGGGRVSEERGEGGDQEVMRVRHPERVGEENEVVPAQVGEKPSVRGEPE